MVRNQILSLVIISSFLARKRSVPCWWLGCFEHHRFVRLERRLVGTQRTELWPRWTRKLEHGVWCVSIKLPTKKMHQGTDQYPMRTNSSRNLIMVNFSAYLNKFETFFTVTLASTGVSSRLTMTIGSTTRPSAPERTPSVRKTRLATTSTTTPCPRSTFQVWSLTFCLLWSSNQRALNLASCIAYETSELKQQSGRRWCPRTLFGATNNYRKP